MKNQKTQRSQRKNVITHQVFEGYVSDTAKTVRNNNTELNDIFLRNKFGNDAVTYTESGKRIVNIKSDDNKNDNQNQKSKGVFNVKRNVNNNNNNNNDGPRLYDHQIDDEHLNNQNWEFGKSDIGKNNFDRLSDEEIAVHDLFLTLVRQNIADAVNTIDAESWNGKKIVFNVHTNTLYNKLKTKLNVKNLKINFSNMFAQENKKGKKIIAVNLFRSLNEFDNQTNTRTLYEGYIIGGCSIVLDKNNNKYWKIILFVEKY